MMVLVEKLWTNIELDKESLCIFEGRVAPSFVKYDCEEVLEFNKDLSSFLIQSRASIQEQINVLFLFLSIFHFSYLQSFPLS